MILGLSYADTYTNKPPYMLFHRAYTWADTGTWMFEINDDLDHVELAAIKFLIKYELIIKGIISEKDSRYRYIKPKKYLRKL